MIPVFSDENRMLIILVSRCYGHREIKPCYCWKKNMFQVLKTIKNKTKSPFAYSLLVLMTLRP